MPSTTADVPSCRLFQPRSFLSAEALLPTVSQRRKRRPKEVNVRCRICKAPALGFHHPGGQGGPWHPLPSFVSSLVRIPACGQCRLPCPRSLQALDPVAFQPCSSWGLILPLCRCLTGQQQTRLRTQEGRSGCPSASVSGRGAPSRSFRSSPSDGKGMLFASTLNLPKGDWSSSREEATLGIKE